MTHDAGMGREPHAEELTTILDWIDGNLPEEAALAFELRLSAEPELAARVEELSNLDALVRRHVRAGTPLARTRLHWGIWVAIAAAAVLAIAILPRFFAPTAPVFEIALAAGYASAEDWTQQTAELKGACAPGIAVSRGTNPVLLSPEEFLRRSTLSEDAVMEQALDGKRHELEAGWFVVPIELSAPASVVVLSFSPNAGPRRLFPDPESAATLPDAARLEAGRRLLPSPRAEIGRSGQSVVYRPGYLVPLDAGELVLLVAVREADVDAATLALVDASIEQARSANATGEFMVEAGFSVQKLRVREPR